MSAENEKSPAAVQDKSAREDTASDVSKPDHKHIDNVYAGRNLNAKLANPLYGIPHDQLMDDGAAFARSHGLAHLEDEFRKAALVAQDPTAFESLTPLSEEDRIVLRRELTHKWSQPFQLYYLVILCSLSAAVQGVCHAFVSRLSPMSLMRHNVDGRVGHQRSQFVLPATDWHSPEWRQ